MLGSGLAQLAGLAVAAALAMPGAVPSAAAAASDDQAAENRLRDCQSFLVQAFDEGIVRDVGTRDGTVGVVVDRDVWNEMTQAARIELAEAVNCWVFAGDDGKDDALVAHIQFLGHRDYVVLADWGPGGLR